MDRFAGEFKSEADSRGGGVNVKLLGGEQYPLLHRLFALPRAIACEYTIYYYYNCYYYY